MYANLAYFAQHSKQFATGRGELLWPWKCRRQVRWWHRWEVRYAPYFVSLIKFGPNGKELLGIAFAWWRENSCEQYLEKNKFISRSLYILPHALAQVRGTSRILMIGYLEEGRRGSIRYNWPVAPRQLLQHYNQSRTKVADRNLHKVANRPWTFSSCSTSPWVQPMKPGIFLSISSCEVLILALISA